MDTLDTFIECHGCEKIISISEASIWAMCSDCASKRSMEKDIDLGELDFGEMGDDD